MLCGFDLTIYDVDIYAKRLGLFYKNKEKISSYFGFTLTLLYIFISLGIFIIYTIKTINHVDLQSNDSTIYSQEIPNINLNNSDLLYFAFAVEIPEKASRFIDETIYTVKALFYDAVKNENGEFEPIEQRYLKVEKCQQEKFGKNYQHLFTNGEFNNSYCINALDFILRGGFIYDKLSLIRLDIYPCKNTTENNYHCKPQEIIDQYLAGGYFSILLKDVGLNPGNYSFPVLPTLQDLYTTISKQFFRDLILYYEITEIRTDSGIFFEDVSSERYLKFNKLTETLFLRSDDYYYNGDSLLGVQIRLSDNIHVQNRVYKKMHNVFATAGGYMQMLNTIFSLLIIFPNKFFYDNIIVDSLFDFDTNKNKIVSKNNRKEHNITRKKYTSDLESFKKASLNINNMNFKNFNKNDNLNKSEKKFNSKKDIQSIDKCINLSAYEKINNASKIEDIPFTNELNIINNKNLIFLRKNKKSESNTKELNSIEESISYTHFKLNILDYLCLGRCREKDKNYKLFKKGTIAFKQKLDIINIFNCILLNEKKNE